MRRDLVKCSHDLRLLTHYAERMLLVEHGRVRATGATAQILQRYHLV